MGRIGRLGVRVYGAAAILLGLVGLAFGDFAAVWQPVPATVPGRAVLAYLIAALLLAAGLAIQWRRTTRLGALALTTLYALGVLVLHLPRVIAHPISFPPYAGVAEQMALVAGGLLAVALTADLTTAARARLIKTGEVIFGVCLVCFGAAHFADLPDTAAYAPKWLPPSQLFWAYATGAAHLAAAIAILSGVLARPAARLLTAMFIGFSLLVHIPNLLVDLHGHVNWSANAINLALIGAAWVLVDALDRRET
jgi:uncharacterized membrane protein YphA (DoxX/SURF4 family)